MAANEPDIAIYGAEDIVFEADDNQDTGSPWSQSDDEAAADASPYRNEYRHIKSKRADSQVSVAIHGESDIDFEADLSDDEDSEYNKEESNNKETTGFNRFSNANEHCGVANKKGNNKPGVAIYGEDDILFESDDDEDSEFLDSDAQNNNDHDDSVEFMLQLREQRHTIAPDDEEESWSDSDSSSGYGSTYSIPSSADDSPFRCYTQLSHDYQIRLSYDQQDTWTDSDSHLHSFLEPHQTPKHEDQVEKDAEWLSSWECKMRINRAIAQGKYTVTEQRLLCFKWKSQFFTDGRGHLGILQERVLDAHRFAIERDPGNHGLSACRWHKSKVPPRNNNKKRESDDELDLLPEIKLTDHKGENWYLDDLTYYQDEDDDEEDEDEEAY
ncbi:hypothetical protein VTI74DRAFT_10891 [Chaetomium olivicolor]